MSTYNFKEIENKWKKYWFKNNIYKAEDFSEKPKKYILAEYPYPSGKSIHVGHAMRYTAPEMYSRFLRMRGYNVLFPMGWDAFGLPSEVFASQVGKTPLDLMDDIEVDYKKAMQDVGYAFDWDREISTCHPDYYKWTQWLFLKFYENNLAEIKEMPVWWCEQLGILADEEIISDKNGNKISERGNYPVTRKRFKQWVLKIPEYADKLLQGLNEVDFPESIKNAQKSWIGKSEGTYICFKIYDYDLEVFTTRPDTIYGVTYIVLAPENSLVQKLLEKCENKEEVKKYIENAKTKSDLERIVSKEKTGIRLKNIYAKHPMPEIDFDIPVFVSDYVLADYAGGCVMGVPAHDQRDYEFAKKKDLNIIEVITGGNIQKEAYEGEGKMINSFKYNGIDSEKFRKVITKELENIKKGRRGIAYKIRDWVFSRKRYWGDPIPVVYKQNGEIEAVAETNLPVELPYLKDFLPPADGSSPLEKAIDWVNITDSKGNPAKRETQTMPTWAGSNWYYLRYTDPKNDKEFANMEKMKYWLPVDRYFGGAEHTTVHLLYSRFWHKFFYDLELVPTKEPFAWRMNGGLILGADGNKMSKSKGNVVEPKKYLDKYGADAFRMGMVFLGPYDGVFPWNPGAIKSMSKFLENLYSFKIKIHENIKIPENIIKAQHKMIKNVTKMMEDLKMNTTISEIMIFFNKIKHFDKIDLEVWNTFLKVLAPLAPFITEELWHEANKIDKFKPETSVHLQKWPEYDEKLITEDTLVIPVQINGKVRSEIEIERNEGKLSVEEKALSNPKIQKYLNSKKPEKIIYVENKIVNIVL